MLAEGRTFVVGPEHALFLQQRHHLVGEPVQAAGGDVRDQDEPVAGFGLDVGVDCLGDRLRRADERLAAGHLDHQLADRQVVGLGPGPPASRVSTASLQRPGLSRALGAHLAAEVGVDLGSGPSGS